MKRYLVVANQTLGGEHLLAELRALASAGPVELHVLVPASSDPRSGMHDLGSDVGLAQRRLATALDRFEQLSVAVTGEVGDHRPVDAVKDVLRRERFDGIVLSTLPAGASRWLKLDTVSQIDRATELPVTHVVADEPAER